MLKRVRRWFQVLPDEGGKVLYFALLAGMLQAGVAIGMVAADSLFLAKLGLLTAIPACTDLTTKPWVQEAGVEVLNQPFFAAGNLATAGGCFAAPYLAAWIIARLVGEEAARSALHYVAPVGEKDEYVSRAMNNIAPYLPSNVA